VSWVETIARSDILALKAYEYAAWEPDLTRLHANELPWRSPGDHSFQGLNRYPEPQPRALVERLASLYRVPTRSVLVTRGSDEAIDLLIRGFCRPGEDAIVVCPPTFGMYAIAAQIHGAKVLSVPLRQEDGFSLDEKAVLERCTSEVKIVFLCSPNNPTGNALATGSIRRIAQALEGRTLVAVDEAYIEFSGVPSLARYLPKLSNLAILRTLSKAHGLAGARCGTLLADPEVIGLLKKVISPYAITQLTVEAVLKLTDPSNVATMRERTALIRAERERVARALSRLRCVRRVWPSQANFILVEFEDAARALIRASAAQLQVRDARGFPGLSNAVRITIGTAAQNERLLGAWA
jgi:histidinol-phosphate aminotransferase